MKTKLFSFQDGLRLVHVKMEGVRSVAIGILTGAGSANESADNNGISHFIEHMLFKGTKTRTSYDIVKEVDALGAQINAYTTKQATCFYTIGLDEASDKCCEILSDLLFESVFDTEELEKRRSCSKRSRCPRTTTATCVRTSPRRAISALRRSGCPYSARATTSKSSGAKT